MVQLTVLNFSSFFQLAPPDAVYVVVGNKCDLENARVISTEQGQSFADEQSLATRSTQMKVFQYPCNSTSWETLVEGEK